MTVPQRTAGLLAGIAGLLAAAEVVWVVVFLGHAGDGPAFAMALVTVVLIPMLLAASGAALVPIPRSLRVAGVAAVGVSGLAASGVVAGVFVADDPTDPAFIRWFAAVPPVALPAAMLLIGVVAGRLLRPLRRAARVALTVVSAFVVPVVLTGFLLTGTTAILLGGIAAPVVLVGRAFLRTRRRTAL